jgi:uncharacterized membrane protein YebE (DUF533 family)
MRAMNVKIGRDTLIALAAVAWADGELDPEEAAGIRAAAQQLGFGADDLRAVEETLGHPVQMEEVETVRMSRLTRLFTFAAASWIAHLDRGVSAKEQAALDMLGERLGLSDLARERARSVGLAVAKTSGDRPASYDLQQLKSRLSVGLSEIGNE